MSQTDKDLELFYKHQEICEQCRFFPISPACYKGAKIANPRLDVTEDEYWTRIKEGHDKIEKKYKLDEE